MYAKDVLVCCPVSLGSAETREPALSAPLGSRVKQPIASLGVGMREVPMIPYFLSWLNAHFTLAV